jgi:hypothetical protein
MKAWMRRRASGAMLSAILTTTAAAQAPLFRELGTELPGRTNHFLSIDADLDLDGKRDLAMCDFESGRIVVRRLRNDGTGRFADLGGPVDVTSLGWVFDLDAGDFDGDGSPDLFVASEGANGTATGTVLLTATGGLAFGASFPLPGVCSYCAAQTVVRDFNGDGFADVALTHASGPPLMLNNNGGAFFSSSPAGMSGLASGTLLMDCGDADHDGDADLIAAQTDGTVFRLENNSGVMTLGPAFAPSFVALSWSYGLGDFNGDGFVDVVMTPFAAAGPEYQVSFATGGPLVLASIVRTGTAWATFGLDYDGDGADEVVRQTTGYVTVEMSGSPTELRRIPVFGYGQVRGFDADDDGDRDLLYPDASGDRLLRAVPGDLIDASDGLPPGTFGDLAAIAGDFDGDGDVDFLTYAVFHPTTGAAGFFRHVTFNDGRGRYSAGPAQTAAATSLSLPIVADFEGDGDDDVAHCEAGAVKFLIGDGAGSFYEIALGLPGTPAPIAGVIATDLDQDGDADLVVARTAPANDLLWIRNETPLGPTIVALNLPGATSSPSDLAAADLDQDGDPDLAIACTQGSSVLLYNDGLGGFTSSTPASFGSASSIAIGDVDGNGERDVLLGDQVYLQIGLAFWTGPTTGLTSSAQPGKRRLADLDGDGFADLVAPYEFRRSVGGGSFGAALRLRPRPGSQSAWRTPWFWADLDRDGDQELFDGHGALYWNAAVQLHAGSTIGLGRTATLELYGPPGAYFELFGSAAAPAGDPVLPVWGRLGIDPSSAFLAATGTFDAGGAARVQFVVPSSAAFAGFPIYWQAAIPSLPRLTGALRTVIRGL